MTAPPITSAMVDNRKRLAELLGRAAEVEHGVMCLYLFTASTMKATAAEGGVTLAQLERMRVWRAHMMTVARQEMEHIGIVLNLLSAIGEAPMLRRANFPFTVSYRTVSQALSLERFSVDTIRSFALLEMPQGLLPDSRGWRILSSYDPHFSPAKYDVIAQVYDDVEQLINAIPEHALFIGPPSAQFVNDSLMPLAIRGITIAGSPLYNVNLTAITDRASALKAVSQLKEEGEGAKLEGGPGSHFSVFLDILEELRTMPDPGFAPARPVVSNPTLTGEGPSVITHPITVRVMRLFDMCYETLVIMLIRYFAATDESSTDEYSLERAAFFPMMTTVIRPLAECLTWLPAYDGARPGEACAGPSFVLPPNLAFLPHRDAAFTLLIQNYTQMVETAQDISVIAKQPDAPPALARQADRLDQVYQVLWRSRYNLEVGWAPQAP